MSFEDSKDDRQDSEKSDRPPQYEMKEFGHQDVPSDEAEENDTLIRRSLRQKKKKKDGSTSSGDGSRPKNFKEWIVTDLFFSDDSSIIIGISHLITNEGTGWQALFEPPKNGFHSGKTSWKTQKVLEFYLLGFSR